MPITTYDVAIAEHLGKSERITELHRQEALLKTGALQNAILTSANFAIIATDEKGIIQVFNVGAQRMLGYEAAEVKDKITPADISDPHEVIARAATLSIELDTNISPGFEALVFKASRGIEDIYELTYIRKDGSRIPAVVSVTALRDTADDIIGYLLIGTDNTARKQVEAEQKKLDQRLRDQQFYTRSLIESHIDALMTTDPAGIITDVNKQMEALTDCTRDELIGAPFKNYFTDPKRADAAIKRVLNENKVTDYELIVRARNGTKTDVSYNATTFYDRDRKLQGVFAAARDITERRRLDKILEEKNIELENAKSVAEKANLAKSEFLSSMSHELRTPLSAILGFAQLMESSTPEPTPMQKRSITQILKGGWYLLELINEILDLALIESGKLSLSLEPISLNDVMRECAAMVEPQSHKRSLTLSFPDFENNYFVNADRTRLKQVLINLLSNAIKYNRPNGNVIVTCTIPTENRIRISVEDNGDGLSPDKISQLFQPFNRLGQETKDQEGTGIGLVMTKRLIELMGGDIGLKSTPGKGSIFWFEMNIAAQPDHLAIPKITVTPMTPIDSMKIDTPLYTLLYVEDNPANLMLVEDLMERRPNINLLTARDGNRGVELARMTLPDVILMDINLPGISGIQALKILANDVTTAHIPVIALSANAIPTDIEKGLKAGFFRYLTKPIKVDEFMDTLNLALKIEPRPGQ
ncbi:MAG: PAS domain-containing sensor histidine kinase [Gammaproteobacteria bacterium]|nr:MAG: PAS domain-containing sensor histidine kinase [Gammaproteobacteria bacterium]